MFLDTQLICTAGDDCDPVAIAMVLTLRAGFVAGLTHLHTTTVLKVIPLVYLRQKITQMERYTKQTFQAYVIVVFPPSQLNDRRGGVEQVDAGDSIHTRAVQVRRIRLRFESGITLTNKNERRFLV